MRVTVTAATSKAGVEIVRRLARKGILVTGTTHASAERSTTYAAAFRPVDFLRPETLPPAFAGSDAAVLIVPDGPSMASMTANLVEAARHSRVRRLVLLSFLHADSARWGPMMSWHRQCERAVEDSQIAFTCLRPNYYMQNFLSLCRLPTRWGGGDVSYIDARDVADAVIAVLGESGHESRTYSLTGPRSFSLHEVAELLKDEAGSALSPPPLGWVEPCFAQRRSSHPPHIQALCEFWLAASEGDYADVTADAERLLGRSPTDLVDFLREHHGQCHRMQESGQAA